MLEFESIVWPDDAEWLRIGVVFTGILALIGLTEGLRYVARFPSEVSRKFVHFAIGVGILFSPRLFLSPVPLILLSLLFIPINLLAVWKGWLPGIHGPDRRSFGTVYFPVSLLVLTVVFWQRSPELVALAMFSFAVGDAAAALVGESLPRPRTYTLTGDRKSVEGSIAMFIATAASVTVGAVILWPGQGDSAMYLVVMSASAAVLATMWEAISSKALDNLTVPFSNALVLAVFLFPSTQAPIRQFSLGISLSIAVAALAHRLRMLTLSGSVAAVLLAVIIFGLGGWKWSIPIVVFFVFSSLLSRVGMTMKSDLDSVFEKSSIRDHGQVAANGAIAGGLALAQYAFPGTNFFPAYIGAIAAVTADTWGTEVGVLSRGKTVSLVSLQEVPRGTSGGVSIAGSAAAVAGALLISFLGAQWTGIAATAVAGLLGGLSGTIVDSLAGELVQAKYRCTVCGKHTERREHCGAAADLTGGRRLVGNDGVNWICAATGAVVAALMHP